MKILKLCYVEETFKNFHSGMLSFIGQRLTGIAIVFYLVMHIYSLSSVLRGGKDPEIGENAFRAMMASYDTPLFRVGEFLLFIAIAFHALNGVRIVLADWLGLTRIQKQMFWGVVAGTAFVSAVAIPFFFLWR
jgi:succinate dehydrogenase / fumarate reductase cytochrome b subunit